MAITVARSGNHGLGTIDNTAGSLITILDKLLVNGWSAAPSSITRSGSVATVTTTLPHGFSVGENATISGCTQTEYNGTFVVASVPSTTTFTYAVTGTPSSPATGSPLLAHDSIGWTKPYSGTNLAAYWMKAGTTRHYLYVDDTGTTSARGWGYEKMSDISTGTGRFPLDDQVSGGMFLSKSSSSTGRDWIFVSDGKLFHFVINYAGGSGASSTNRGFAFGEFISYFPADNFKTVLMGDHLTASSIPYPNYVNQSAISGATTGHYFPRKADGSGTSRAGGKVGDTGASSGALPSLGMGTYGISESFLISNVRLHDGDGKAFRGVMPGLYYPLNETQYSDEEIITSGGKTFIVKKLNQGKILLEVSDTWR